MPNNRQTGAAYEQLAADYLMEQGYEILERNFRCRQGEIDIIAREKAYLCFVEVKFRRGNGCGSPLAAVTERKQKKILQVARYYLMRNSLPLDTACRFDVVAVANTEITLIRNAFGE